ncbi:bacillithiol biosynthesis cysteine-adding enzyme BshC [Metabacillus iocasae]|uniref:Putative cysteine ligase BshC n=1 Tax=Priestia iocasae TaxID=2291674 RepID=A0ABS2QQT1_9BACI|nr:bacillithiol biosynthesis cysteine-adding enzyme BshC [Metabacillus iocasae]MBM7701765.1 bacillithiol biosynthesis cysteine-adding enzyme BshC [Metabacillus iocasae]
MEITDVSFTSTNQLTNDYINGLDKSLAFFHYNIHEKSVYQKRAQYLKAQSYPREELIEYLGEFNKKHEASSETLANIERLQDPNSVVVIGGQQAGLLTGPLYTIHKIISIVLFARQQEQALGIPVLPVFWIAGEDHDFAEINHVYAVEKGKVHKKAVKNKQLTREMVSTMQIDHTVCEKWIEDIFQSFNETEHSNSVRNLVMNTLADADTYVDFFARLTTKLFTHTGLILMDAASPEVRRIESSFFVNLIEQNAKLSAAVVSQQEVIKKSYNPLIEVTEQTAHLFYSQDGERVLLERDVKTNTFTSKQGDTILTQEELLSIARNHPERLSNNVVTRPIMQEYLFPTLSFIAGPGEIAYWAELKSAFELFNFKMPPVVPRLSYVLVERTIESYMRELNVSIEEAVNGEVGLKKEEWLTNEVRNPYEEYFNQAKEEFEQVHQKLRKNVLQEDPYFEELLLKNRGIIQKQFEIAQKIVESKQLVKNEAILKKYNAIELAIRPAEAPQERIWNICYYLNQFGVQFVSDLLRAEVEFNHKLKVVSL